MSSTGSWLPREEEMNHQNLVGGHDIGLVTRMNNIREVKGMGGESDESSSTPYRRNGMVGQSRNLDVIANNLANVGTDVFKSSAPTSRICSIVR